MTGFIEVTEGELPLDVQEAERAREARGRRLLRALGGEYKFMAEDESQAITDSLWKAPGVFQESGGERE